MHRIRPVPASIQYRQPAEKALNFGMIKGILVALLFLSPAATTSAHEDGVQVANVEKDLRPGLPRGAAAPVVTERYEFYDIKGNCEKDLHDQLSKNGISMDDGHKYDALTTWSVKWKLDKNQTGQVCTPDSVKLTVDVVFRYPQWVRPENASRPLIDKWNDYMWSLAVHEIGHRDLVVNAANELARSVAELPPAPTCAELYKKVCDLCCSRMDKLKQDEKRYDSHTMHGVTQGALFP
jgi:predicted secreted Zn-dependent protease